MLNYSRKTEAKLEVLREVVRRVKSGEGGVDVKRALGTGDAGAEEEWEAVVREIEGTDGVVEGRRKREEKAEKRKAEKETITASEGAEATTHGKRPKFLM